MQGPMATEQNVQGSTGEGEAVPVEDYLFRNVIPKLGPKGNQDNYPALLPHLGGQPGYEYFQCSVTRQRDAQAAGWKPVRDTSVYSIEGPLGRLDLVLLCQGTLIKGSDTQNNKRIVYLDPSICEITGLDPVTGLIPVPEADGSDPATDVPGEHDTGAGDDTAEATSEDRYTDTRRVEGIGNFASAPEGVPIKESGERTGNGPEPQLDSKPEVGSLAAAKAAKE